MADLNDLIPGYTPADWMDFQLSTAVELELPTTAWREETPERVILQINANALAGDPVNGIGSLGTLAIEAIRGGFLGYARGPWLDVIAEDTFNTPRIQATFASALVTLTNTSNSPYSIPDGDYLTARNTATDALFRVLGPIEIPALDSVDEWPPGTPLVAVALLPGSGGTSAIGEISELQDGLIGVTIANTTVAVGIDQEQDEPYRARARLASGPLSPAGPRAAYEYVALSAKREDGNSVDVTKVLVREDEDTGTVRVVIASDNGPSADLVVVEAELFEKVRPNGIKLFVSNAIALEIDITATLYADESFGVASSAIIAAATAALIAYIPRVPIEGYDPIPPGLQGVLPATKLKAVIESAVVEGVRPVYDVTGITDTLFVVDAGERAVAGTITLTVVQQ